MNAVFSSRDQIDYENLPLQEKGENNNIQNRANRDISNFLQIRHASPGDDIAIGNFLLSTFVSTYERKLPTVITSEDRKKDLLDVTTKRRSGVVCVLELGYKMVGTFSLIHPDSKISEAWLPNSGNLRCVAIDPQFHGYNFSEILLRQSLKLANTWKLGCICLHVQKGATKVAELYERFGYKRDTSGDMVANGLELEGYYFGL